MNGQTHPQAKLQGNDGKWWLVHVPIGIRPQHVLWFKGRCFLWHRASCDGAPMVYFETTSASLDSGAVIEEGR